VVLLRALFDERTSRSGSQPPGCGT
jgi:hypothetical protein